MSAGKEPFERHGPAAGHASERADDSGSSRAVAASAPPSIADPAVASNASLRAIYAERLAASGFQADSAQLRAVDKLDDLRRRLIAAQESNGSVLRRWLGSLVGNSSREDRKSVV